MVDDPKRMLFQLPSSEVNMFCLRKTFAIILRVMNCDFMHLVNSIRKTKNKAQQKWSLTLEHFVNKGF